MKEDIIVPPYEVSIINFEKGIFKKTTSLVPCQYVVDLETMDIKVCSCVGSVTMGLKKE